jgi:hypothetical protein
MRSGEAPAARDGRRRKIGGESTTVARPAVGRDLSFLLGESMITRLKTVRCPAAATAAGSPARTSSLDCS